MRYYRIWDLPKAVYNKINSKEVDELCESIFPTPTFDKLRTDSFHFLILTGDVTFVINSKLNNDGDRVNTILSDDKNLVKTDAILSTVGFGMPLKSEPNNG
jgi:hypothetical protein|tara:strand:+ start:243 stop:545 length:303 start_codon:yes stop_codon:yes gene_type:complete